MITAQNVSRTWAEICGTVPVAKASEEGGMLLDLKMMKEGAFYLLECKGEKYAVRISKGVLEIYEVED